MGDEGSISNRGWHNVALIVMAVCCRRFADHEKPLSQQTIAVQYYLPIRIVGRIFGILRKAGLIYEVNMGNDETGITPAIETPKKENNMISLVMPLLKVEQEEQVDFLTSTLVICLIFLKIYLVEALVTLEDFLPQEGIAVALMAHAKAMIFYII